VCFAVELAVVIFGATDAEIAGAKLLSLGLLESLPVLTVQSMENNSFPA
jgi:hypothetical protein